MLEDDYPNIHLNYTRIDDEYHPHKFGNVNHIKPKVILEYFILTKLRNYTFLQKLMQLLNKKS